MKKTAVISNKHIGKVMGHMAVYHQNQSATLRAQEFFKSLSESPVFSTITFLKHQLRNQFLKFQITGIKIHYSGPNIWHKAHGKNQLDTS